MFDLSLAEIILVVVVALVFIGPKELPVVMKSIIKAMRSIRALGAELKAAFDDMAKESGIKDATDELNQNMRMIRGDDGKLYESYMSPEEARAREVERKD